MPKTPFGLRTSELFGLRPLKPTWAQAKKVFLGDDSLPKSRFDHTSLNITTPRLSLRTWLGQRPTKRVLPILNLYNYKQPPPEDGWSVRFTQVEDFRGKKLAYDSHNGTDFVIPPGTKVTASAPGRVCAIRQEFNRGGLKVYVDHGRGLITTYHHLGRALCRVGDEVRRGQVIALSAYSGADGFLTFPWVAPHVHFNTILNGVIVDPFAPEAAASTWMTPNDPRPPSASEETDRIAFTPVDERNVAALLDALIDDEAKHRFAAITDTTERGFELLIESTTYPTRFRVPNAGRLLYDASGEVRHEREGRMTLPFLADDFDRIGFADELGYR